jgi:hypothetical protein
VRCDESPRVRSEVDRGSGENAPAVSEHRQDVAGVVHRGGVDVDDKHLGSGTQAVQYFSET